MASLQIRDMPEDIYRALSAKASLEHRSLTQQALVELIKSLRAEPNPVRRQVLAKIRNELNNSALPVELSPEVLIAEDRLR
ncbi:hypothetical protein [uncultured Thiothrix sp.]|uniref:hypothetical protein n=1 Tax=uncultured Thiothrix sp. TaxID=223185 RepID=UPI0026122926|nr:hypothetical protein [uncultured Thiothrix sp.]